MKFYICRGLVRFFNVTPWIILLDLNKRIHCKTGGCRCAVLQNFLRIQSGNRKLPKDNNEWIV